jgi:hypothetical protein
VDGRQRIESFIKYVSGEFTVPAAWWDSDKVFLSDLEIRARFLDPAGEIGFADLNQQGKRWFLRQPLPTHETTFKTLAEEEALFELINHGGCAQGSVDDD